MSDEEEMEDFEMNDEDLMRAYNPGYKRHKMSKEEAMLGVWATREYSDSEDEDDFSFKNQKKISKKTPVDFISSSKGKNKSSDNEIEDDKISDDDNDNMDELTTKDYYQVKQVQPSFKTSQKQTRKEHVPKAEIKEIGNWERHTKGIGMKLLAKMGWEKGKGLGKDLGGRAIPVEATVRKGKGAIGAHGSENKESRFRVQEDEEEEEPVHVSQWKKDKKNKRPKYALKTPDELIQQALKQPDKLKKIEQMLEMNELEKMEKKATNKIKIIDMTGREQRVMHGYECITHITKLSQLESKTGQKKRENFDVPELTHNLDLILNMTEDRLIHYDKKTKHYEDMIVSLAYEEKRTKEKMNSEAEQIEKVKNLIQTIERCEALVNEDDVSLNELIELFQDLQQSYPDEFIIFNLSQVSIPLMTPLLKRKMKLWRPFENDKSDNYDNPESMVYCYDIFEQLKVLLNDSNYDGVNLYHRLVWDTWMPTFRKLLSEISIKEFSVECSDLLNKWSSLLSNWIIQNILNQFVLPKLISEVEEWNPLTDPVPIHEWIHPWLRLMKDRIDSNLFPTIRFKLATALQSWHPSDQSAKAILLPWKPPVFASQNWEQFIFKNILPKLEMVFEQDFVISPNEQNLEPWNWVMSWLDVIPISNFVSLLEKCFFPKWLKVLSVWLNSKPNYEQVSKWYVGWKSLFDEKLVQHPNVKAKLTQGLLMMNRSVSGAQVSYNPNEPSVKVEEPETVKQKGVQLSSTPAVSSFKDIIEKKAGEHNLMFAPITNKFKEGKQVYRLGNLNVYLDRNVAFMLQNGNWIPSSLSEIMQKAL